MLKALKVSSVEGEFVWAADVCSRTAATLGTQVLRFLFRYWMLTIEGLIKHTLLSC